jgi:hypothetical protein
MEVFHVNYAFVIGRLGQAGKSNKSRPLDSTLKRAMGAAQFARFAGGSENASQGLVNMPTFPESPVFFSKVAQAQ